MRYVFGEYELDTDQRILRHRGEEIEVQEQVFDVLAYLIEHRDDFVSTDEFLDALWPGVSVSPSALSQSIHRARQAVGDDGEHQTVLRTKHGRGFQFVAQVSVVPAADADPSSPVRSRARLATAAGVAALLLAALVAWFLSRSVGSATDIHSLAVLPLKNLSGDQEQEYFADGMTEELISTLAKIKALRVISRTSAMHYKDTQKSLPEIARELNVDAIVEGSVLRSGNRVRITAQLIHGATDQHLWAEQYERDLREVLGRQSEISRAIAREVQLALAPDDETRLAAAHVVDPEAYEWRMKGSYFENKHEFESATEAHKKAIEIDSNYADAYAGLSFSYSLRASWGFQAPAEVLPQAYAAVMKALELEPANASAHNALGMIRMVERNWHEAKESFERAIVLDPGYSWAYAHHAIVLSALGHPEEAIAAAARAQQLNPLSDGINANLIDNLEGALRWDEAIDEGNQALSLNPEFERVRVALIWAYLRAGRHKEAIKHASDFVERSNGSADAIATMSWVLVAMGQVEEGIELQRSYVEENPDFAPGYRTLGSLYTFTGHIDDAVRSYEEAFALVPESWVYMFLARRYLTLGDVERVTQILETPDALNPDPTHALAIRDLLHRYRGEGAQALETARLLADQAERPSIFHGVNHFVWLRDLQRIDADAALGVYARIYPELLRDPPDVMRGNNGAAASLALLWLQSGDADRAAFLLRESLATMDLELGPGRFGHGPDDIMVHCIRGDRKQAMAALERDLDAGVRLDWWPMRASTQNSFAIRHT